MGFITALPNMGGVLPIDASLCTAIESGEDLNNLTNPGVYFAPGSVTKTCSNLPSSFTKDGGCRLTVSSFPVNAESATSLRVCQILETRDTGECFWKRHKLVPAGTWSAWYKYTGIAD